MTVLFMSLSFHIPIVEESQYFLSVLFGDTSLLLQTVRDVQ